MDFLYNYLLVGVIFVAIDAAWLAFVASRFYKSQIGTLLRDKLSIVPAVLFYLIYVLGIVVFALNPALGKDSLSYAASHGALLGLIAYGAYGLVNNATLNNWSKRVTVLDTAWGVLVTALATTLAFLLLS